MVINKIIEFKNATFKYQNEFSENSFLAFKNVNLSIAKGEFVALMGPNGCGKSTLAKHMNGLLVPTLGDVFVSKVNTREESKLFDIRKKVGMVFQNPDDQMVTSMVEDEIAFGLENICMPSEKMPSKIKKALELVDLAGFEKRTTHSLSGGQKQRLAIACTIAMEPEVIVFDEPTSMLDPCGRKKLMKIILMLNKTLNVTVVLVTHFIEEALISDRLILMQEGLIKSAAKPHDILASDEFIDSNEYSMPDGIRILRGLKKNGYNVSLKAFSSFECAKEILGLLGSKKC